MSLQRPKRPREVWNKIGTILLGAQRSLGDGQARYAEHFGRNVDDRAINKAIDKLFDEAEYNESGQVCIPAELLLAIKLRKDWRHRGRIRTAPYLRRIEAHRIRFALESAVELEAKGMPPEKAWEIEAERAQKGLVELRHPLDTATIRKRMQAMKRRIAELVESGVPKDQAAKTATDEAAARRRQ